VSSSAPTETGEILLVDDDPRLRELVRFTLARAGFTVREAADGRQALDAVAHGEPDLIVLDILMPELDGLSVCRELRQRGSRVPILFLSTRADAVDRITGLDSGADDYLSKPFAPAELVSRARAILRRARAPVDTPVSTLAANLVRLDVAAHRVWVRDAEVSLTATEFRMLQALLQRPGEVVTRERMVHAAYGGVHHISPRTLDSHVRGVRQKLRDSGCDRVETVTAVGWRWNTA
jgi:two-component system OmpR family response regulator